MAPRWRQGTNDIHVYRVETPSRSWGGVQWRLGVPMHLAGLPGEARSRPLLNIPTHGRPNGALTDKALGALHARMGLGVEVHEQWLPVALRNVRAWLPARDVAPQFVRRARDFKLLKSKGSGAVTQALKLGVVLLGGSYGSVVQRYVGRGNRSHPIGRCQPRYCLHLGCGGCR